MSNISIQKYPLSPATRGRIFGVALIALGLLVLVIGGIAILGWLSNTAFDVLVVLAVILTLVVAALLGPRHWIVRLDDTGYSVRFIRTAGVKAARWVEVNDMEATTVAGARCVVLNLRDGRSTTIPVDLIAGGGQPFAEDITAHLKQANR
jgi:hypothetical protein